MPSKSEQTFEYRIDQDLGLAVVRVAGHVSGTDIGQFANTLQNDPNWKHDYAAIWDERGIWSLDVSQEDLEVMVKGQAKGEFGPDIIVTVRDDHQAVMKLYAWRVRARGRPAQVCSTIDEALSLLGLEQLPPELDELTFEKSR